MQKYTSANTSINSTKAPALYKMPKAIEYMRGKNIIDIGGGKYDIACLIAAEYGANVSIYDPYNRDFGHNAQVMQGQYDVAVTSNVLNVIDSAESRQKVIRQCAQKAPIILVTVYEGDGSGIGKVTKTDCWQENRKTADYTKEISDALPNWTVIRYGKLIVCTI